LTSKQRRNFPVPIGAIMLPFLLASACGIIIFGFNIFFVNYNKAHAVSYGLSIKSQNNSAKVGAAHANPGLVVPAAGPKFQRRDLRSASGDLGLPKNTRTAKTEDRKNNNVAAIPAGNQPQRTEAKKTEPAPNVSAENQPLRTEVKKIEPAPVSPTAGTQNWVIQAGAFSIESSAIKVKEKIVPLGYKVEILKTGTEKPLFKVMVSAGNSGATPSDALKRLKSNGIDGYITAGRP